MRKIIRWSTPKKSNPKYEKINHAPGISKYECKKNEGDHKLLFVKEGRGLFGSQWNEYICTVCGKKVTDTIIS